MKGRVLVLLTALLLAAAGRAFAHHSFAATYDASKHKEVEGIVKEFVWRNPHSFLRIDVPDEKDKDRLITWTLEWGSVTQLSESNLTRNSLRIGDRIIVLGEPARDPDSPRMRVFSVKRPIDGWEWKGQVD